MADHMNHAGTLDGLEHLLGLRQRVGKWLLAEHYLLCVCCSERDRQVGVPRGTYVFDVNVFPGNNLLPGSCIFLPPKLSRGLLYGVFGATADDLHCWLKRSIEEFVNLSPGIAMRPAHELVPDHRYIQFLFHGGESRIFCVDFESRSFCGFVPTSFVSTLVTQSDLA